MPFYPLFGERTGKTMNDTINSIDADLPLCVDLDGTLIRTDMLFEALCLLVRRMPLVIFLLPFWLYRGKAYMKARIAEKVTPDAALLPYNKDVLDWLLREKLNGRSIILATASHQSYAQSVAQHLGLFDGVEASDDSTNLRSQTKADRLTHEFGEYGFDYVGNSRADYSVWEKARNAYVVGDEPAAQKYLTRLNAYRIEKPAPVVPRWKLWFKAIRVHQWLKNTLLFVPSILASRYFELDTLVNLGLAFIAFSFCASSVYLTNDLVDIEVDRKHPTKRNRPIASGQLSVPDAVLGALALLCCSTWIALLLPMQFSLILLLYFVITCGYSLILKRLLLIDVLTLAGLFTIRVLAGAAAVGGELSTWLLAFCMFFFLSLALVKRFVELDGRQDEAGRLHTGRGYQSRDLETLSQGGMASGFAAVVVLALFIDSPQITENYARPEVIWLVCPLVLYLIFRIWILARRKEMNDDPVVFLMTDWRSQIMVAAGATTMIISQIM